tara:strand:- start:2040 stop:2177 length:138 start_codon:yes stop_codon:yes gene_type:complete
MKKNIWFTIFRNMSYAKRPYIESKEGATADYKNLKQRDGIEQGWS